MVSKLLAGVLIPEAAFTAQVDDKLLGVQFGVHGEKNFLGSVCASRANSGFPASVLVGVCGDHSDSVHRLVGGVPQRLVLRVRIDEGAYADS